MAVLPDYFTGSYVVEHTIPGDVCERLSHVDAIRSAPDKDCKFRLVSHASDDRSGAALLLVGSSIAAPNHAVAAAVIARLAVLNIAVMMINIH
jgi:hypothetical protein